VSQDSGNSQTPFYVLIGISVLETLALTAATAILIIELFIAEPDSYASAIFLTAITAGFAVALGVITRGLWRGVNSARSASLVWQVLQMALGLASDNGEFGIPLVALALGVPAVTAIVLMLFNGTVRAHFEDEEA